MRITRISDNTLHAALTVAIVHLLTTVSILLHVKGHWGWYGSLVATVWVLTYIGSELSARADASSKATTEVLTRFYR
jgi:hypothetical protein